MTLPVKSRGISGSMRRATVTLEICVARTTVEARCKRGPSMTTMAAAMQAMFNTLKWRSFATAWRTVSIQSRFHEAA